MKKRLFSLLSFSVIAIGSMSAQTHLIVQGKDGGNWTFDISKVKKMLVDNSTFTVWSQNANAIAINKIRSIKFANNATGVETLTGNAESAVSLIRNGNIVNIKGWDSSKPTTVGLYNANGQVVNIRQGWKGESIDLTGLAHGVYVLKINNKTFKLTL